MITIEDEFSYGILAIVAIVAIVALFTLPSQTSVVTTTESTIKESSDLVGEAFNKKEFKLFNKKCDKNALKNFIVSKKDMTKKRLTNFANMNNCKEIINGIKKDVDRISTPTCTLEMGDVNENGEINYDDILALVDVILNGEYVDDIPCGDLNEDGTINILDIVILVDIINVFGCTDTEATNYNPDATIDDDSCEYLTVKVIEILDDEDQPWSCTQWGNGGQTEYPDITIGEEIIGEGEYYNVKDALVPLVGSAYPSYYIIDRDGKYIDYGNQVELDHVQEIIDDLLNGNSPCDTLECNEETLICCNINDPTRSGFLQYFNLDFCHGPNVNDDSDIDFRFSDYYGNDASNDGIISFIVRSASWCPPCVQEISIIDELYEIYEGD